MIVSKENQIEKVELALKGKKFKYKNTTYIGEECTEFEGILTLDTNVRPIQFEVQETDDFLAQCQIIGNEIEVIKPTEIQTTQRLVEINPNLLVNNTDFVGFLKDTLTTSINKTMEDKDFVGQSKAISLTVKQGIELMKTEILALKKQQR